MGDNAAGLTLFWRAPIERAAEGGYRLRLSDEERDLLRRVPAELRALLNTDPADPDLRRLFPPAYEDDAAGEDEYRRLMAAELLAGHREALHVVEETLEREWLGEDDAHAWLRALNELRLVLGTRLGVTEDLYGEDFDARHPQAADLAVYLYLTWLQEQLIEVLADETA